MLLPEVGWYNYGNTFIYDSQALQCKSDDPSLWYCCLILIIFGYLFMLYFLAVVLVALGVFCLYRAWSTLPNEGEANQALSVLPIIGNVDRY